MTESMEDAVSAVARLRESVKAVNRPDEGMRGTRADAAKLEAARNVQQLQSLASVVAVYADDGTAWAAAASASAVIRSIAITADAASLVSQVVAPACCRALAAEHEAPGRSIVLHWLLPAVARLAQHQESHTHLIKAGLLGALASTVSTLVDVVKSQKQGWRI